jgi:hypothetical protein
MIVATDAWTIIPVVVGAVTAFGGLATWFVNGLRAERTRLQTLYADAFSAVVSYQEFPYMIRRRRAPMAGHEEIAGEERLRISGALHPVQESLSNYRAQISTESLKVLVAYDALLHQTRLTAGGYMKEVWNVPALDNDAGMNIAGIDYGGLRAYEVEYLTAARNDVTFWNLWRPWRGKRSRSGADPALVGGEET